MSNKNPIKTQDFDFVMYVDASGDDGFKFGDKSNSSSLCYSVACVLMKTEDVHYNEVIFNNLKRMISSSIEQEIKYTTVRRHKRCNDIYKGLSELKATVYSMNAFKKVITDVDCIDPRTKYLSSMCHYFPINIAGRAFKSMPDKSLLIVIDHMKKSEMDNVKEFIEDCFCRDDEGNSEYNNYTLIFRDSKDKNFLGLQIADWIAGMFRHFSEELYLDNFIWRTCPMCFKMKKKLCSFYRKRLIPSYCFPIRCISKICNKGDNGKWLFNSYIVYPLEHTMSGYLLDCLKI